MISFELNEPQSAPYIFIDEQANVNLMMPLVSGARISTDNTCKTTRAPKAFWSRHGGAQTVLTRYKKAIEKDLEILPPFSEIFAQKQKRLEQIEFYLSAMGGKVRASFEEGFERGIYSHYPKKISRLIGKSETLFPITLSPLKKEHYLKLEKPVCAFSRTRQNWAEALREALKTKGMGYIFIGDRLAETLSKDFPDIPDEQTFERLKSKLSELCRPLGGISDFSTVRHFNSWQEKYTFVPLTKHYIKNVLGLIDEDAPPSEQVRMYTNALLRLCLPKLEKNGFDRHGELKSDYFGRDKLSLLVQLLIAHINIDCLQQDAVPIRTDFGDIIENDEALGECFIQAIATVAAEGISAEQAVFDVLNENHSDFGLKAPLSQEARQRIATQFKKNYAIIEDAFYFDEFLIVGTVLRAGEAGIHQGRICLNFNTVLKAYNEKTLPIPLPKVAQNDFPAQNPIEKNYEFKESDLIDYLKKKHKPAEISAAAQFLTRPQMSENTIFSMLSSEGLAQIRRTPNWRLLRKKLCAAGVDIEKKPQDKQTMMTPSYSAKRSAKQRQEVTPGARQRKIPKRNKTPKSKMVG